MKTTVRETCHSIMSLNREFSYLKEIIENNFCVVLCRFCVVENCTSIIYKHSLFSKTEQQKYNIFKCLKFCLQKPR